MTRWAHVFAPSRLHFGLMSFDPACRQFGGVGVMIDRPGLRLRLSASKGLSSEGPLAERAAQFARRWSEFTEVKPACAIQVVEAPPEHVGLGVGTQLGLAVAAGLNALHDLPAMTPVELAQSVGRGQRSAVGAHGFVLGGMIVERGKTAEEPLSPLDCRIELPASWRFLLVRPTGTAGLSGDDEALAFPPPCERLKSIAEQLAAEINQRLVPAAATADFSTFAESLHRYSFLAGLCFAERQGGAYNGPLLTALVECIRQVGGIGTGQSSWGPTIYCVMSDEEAAAELQKRIAARWSEAPLDFEISEPWNRPAQIEIGG